MIFDLVALAIGLVLLAGIAIGTKLGAAEDWQGRPDGWNDESRHVTIVDKRPYDWQAEGVTMD